MSSTANMMRRMPSAFTGASSGRPDRRRRVELVQLDPPVAVRGPHRGDGGSDAVEPDEAVDRLALDDRLALELQPKFGEESFDSIEVVDNDEDVVHPQNGHCPTIGRAGAQTHAETLRCLTCPTRSPRGCRLRTMQMPSRRTRRCPRSSLDPKARLSTTGSPCWKTS